jgi:hypothetical protein
VPRWPDRQRHVTRHHVLVRMIAETNRHAGHAAIVRELIDGSAGFARTTRTWRWVMRTGGGPIATNQRRPHGTPRHPAKGARGLLWTRGEEPDSGFDAHGRRNVRSRCGVCADRSTTPTACRVAISAPLRAQPKLGLHIHM